MINMAVPDLSGNERKYLNECIDTTFVSSVGKFVEDMERMTAKEAGTRFGVATSSGTTGLHLALLGCGVKYGELVIIPTFTFIATANAVAHCGAIPWIMDIDAKSWTLNVGQLKEELLKKTIKNGKNVIHKESGKRVAAIMPVYTLGNVPDMDAIMEVASEYDIPVIADAAAAIGATYKGKKIGELADLTVFSFNGNKTVTAGGGGMIVGNNEQLMRKLKHLSTTARVTKEYEHDMVGYNYRMTNIQAAVGCAQLERLHTFLQKKKWIRDFYNERLAHLQNTEMFPEAKGQQSACWLSGIIIKDGNLEITKKICERLLKKGIEARSFWKPVHMQKPYENAIKSDSLEVAESIWDKIITLPCSTNITEEEAVYVVESMLECMRKE